MVWSKSQTSAGSSQPGNRHVKSRQRTKRANPADGAYRGSGALSPGWITGRIVAVVASLAANNGAGSIPPPSTTAGLALAGPVPGGWASASAIVISCNRAVVGPGGSAPSRATAVSSDRLFCSAITLTTTEDGDGRPAAGHCGSAHRQA